MGLIIGWRKNMKKLQYLQTLLKHELDHLKQLSKIEEERQEFEQFEKNTKKDPFCIFRYDGSKLEKMLQQVYPDKADEKIRLLYGAKYIYDGSRRYENVLMPQLEETKKVLQTIIDDICTFSHVFYKKVEQEGKEIEKNYQSILTTVKNSEYLNQTDSLEYFLKKSELPISNQLQLLFEVQDYNTSIFKILFEQKQKVEIIPEKKVEEEVLPALAVTEVVMEPEPVIEEFVEEPEEVQDYYEEVVQELPRKVIEEESENDYEDAYTYDERLDEQEEEEEVTYYDRFIEEPEEDMGHEIFSSKDEDYSRTMIEPEEDVVEEVPRRRKEREMGSSYVEDYIKILETMDPDEEYAIYQVLPTYSMPNFEELMDQLISYEESLLEVDEERASQLIRVMKKYINKRDSKRMIDAKRSWKQKKSGQR